MGSAVQASISSVPSSAQAIPGALISGNIGAAAQDASNVQTGGLTNALVGEANSVGNIGTISAANQAQLQQQVALANQNAAQYGTTGQALQGQANTQLGATQAAIGNTQQAIGQAQNATTGGNVANSLGLVGQTAAGGGAAQQAANATLQQGTNQAIASQQAIANSGNASQMISGQKTALDNAAQLQQQNALNAAQLQAGLATTAQGQYTGAAAQQASQLAQNATLQQGQTTANQNLANSQLGGALGYTGAQNTAVGQGLASQGQALGYQQAALTATGQNQAQMTGGLLNAGGGIGAALASDINLKENVEYDSEDPEDSGDSPQTKTAKQIKSGFESGYTLSDKNSKKDIKKDSKISEFLDAIDPVSFKYKESDGKMGKTPGEHLGIIAQQVEKAPHGKSMIVETPKGKGIDLAAAVGTLLSAAAETHDRIKQLEEYFDLKKKKK